MLRPAHEGAGAPPPLDQVGLRQLGQRLVHGHARAAVARHQLVLERNAVTGRPLAGQDPCLDVEPDSAAEKAGLIPARLTRDGGFALGDVLLAIDGQVVDSPDDMTRALETKTPGDRVVLRVRRAGKTIEVRVTLDVAR